MSKTMDSNTKFYLQRQELGKTKSKILRKKKIKEFGTHKQQKVSLVES